MFPSLSSILGLLGLTPGRLSLLAVAQRSQTLWKKVTSIIVEIATIDTSWTLKETFLATYFLVKESNFETKEIL